jgi:hypothetical protein
VADVSQSELREAAQTVKSLVQQVYDEYGVKSPYFAGAVDAKFHLIRTISVVDHDLWDELMAEDY